MRNYILMLFSHAEIFRQETIAFHERKINFSFDLDFCKNHYLHVVVTIHTTDILQACKQAGILYEQAPVFL